MLYNICILTFIILSATGAIWASMQISKAAKEGKLRVMGVTTIRSSRLTDSDRIDWLASNPERLEEIYWRLLNEGDTMREAIDYFVRGSDESE